MQKINKKFNRIDQGRGFLKRNKKRNDIIEMKKNKCEFSCTKALIDEKGWGGIGGSYDITKKYSSKR